MAGRPYNRLDADALAEILSESENNLPVLKQLLHELEHRTTQKAALLKSKVIEAVTRAENSSRPTTLTPLSTPNTRPSGKEGTARPDRNPDDDIPTPPALGRIRKPGPLRDVPTKIVFPPKDEVLVDIKKNASFTAKYEAALKALILDMKKKGASSKQLILENGVQIQLDGRENGYQFQYDGDSELFEGAALTAVIGGQRTDGKIVSVSSKSIIISLNEDFGLRITVCILKIDNTAMLEALRARLEKINNGEVSNFNLALAEAVILNKGEKQFSEIIPDKYLNDLNDGQKSAVQQSLANEIYYLWGPPGTGKTKTIGALCLTLFNAEERLLICSNTNQAVDQVLLKLCDTFKEAHPSAMHPALDDGKVIRVGKIAHEELQKVWSNYVTLDGVIERKSRTLFEQKTMFEGLVQDHDRDTLHASNILKKFADYDIIVGERRRVILVIKNIDVAYRKAQDTHANVELRLRELKAEKERFNTSGSIKRLLLRSIDKIENDIQQISKSISVLKGSISAIMVNQQAAQNEIKQLDESIEKAQQFLNLYDRGELEKIIGVADEKRKLLIEQINTINKQLENVRKTIVDQAQIVGATVTKAFLSPQIFSNFDVVIIDEASMVILPALFHAAGLAKKRVLISGDRRQLRPIVQTNQKKILDIIGGSIFDEIEKNKKGNGDRLSMLDQQYRMTPEICALINSKMYGNGLKTARDRKATQEYFPPPFNDKLIIIDTSPLWPFVNRDPFGSRYNMMHAITIRNMCLYLQSKGMLADARRLGICTPYAAQGRIMKRILMSSNLEIDSGTVHRFQGDEKTAIILEITDSYGEHAVGYFSQAEQPDDDGCLLYNVAVSRAKEQLIIVANLAYLDKKLPAYAFLREILSNMQETGSIIDAREVMALYPIVEELRAYDRQFNLSVDATKSGLYNEHDFEQVFLADIERAKTGVAIFSAFVTPRRVAAYEALFRRKLIQGIKIRCITRPPSNNANIPFDQGKEALDGLERMGCVVDMRGDIHQKCAIIDDEIIWFGSLNPLSFTLHTTETMARLTDKQTALQLASFLTLDRGIRPDTAEGTIYEAENPRCPECNSRVAFLKSRYGTYWKCENCEWKDNYDKPKRKYDGPPLTGEEAPICKCGARMVARNGRYGLFYGCSRYPACKEIINPKKIKQSNHKPR